MSKKKKDTKAQKRNPKAVEIQSQRPDDELGREALMAQTILRPTVHAAQAIKNQYASDDNININALIAELSVQVAQVKEGNLGRAEAMLISQAHTLDALFSELTNRARMNMGQYMDAAYKYMNLAFKAQGQCRTTLEALAEIKNPRPVAFIRQQNVGENVQVNNGTTTRARAEEKSKSTNGLLEDKQHEQEWLDTGAPETAGGNDKELETLGAKHGAKDR